MDDIFKNYLLSNQLLTTKAATAEQTTSSNQDNILVTNIMLDTLAKVKKSYLLFHQYPKIDFCSDASVPSRDFSWLFRKILWIGRLEFLWSAQNRHI